jgi:hypothetical protein
MKIEYDETKEFINDFKKLRKKFPSLLSDLKVVKKNAIELFHVYKIDNGSVFEIQNVGNNRKELKFYKVKKFACKSLKGRGIRSGIRLIHTHLLFQEKIVFLEIYFKGHKEKENFDRIKIYLKDFYKI